MVLFKEQIEDEDVDIEFNCPNCDSTYFSSSIPKQERYCSTCIFKWSVEDDYKHFVKVIRIELDKEELEKFGLGSL